MASIEVKEINSTVSYLCLMYRQVWHFIQQSIHTGKRNGAVQYRSSSENVSVYAHACL